MPMSDDRVLINELRRQEIMLRAELHILKAKLKKADTYCNGLAGITVVFAIALMIMAYFI